MIFSQVEQNNIQEVIKMKKTICILIFVMLTITSVQASAVNSIPLGENTVQAYVQQAYEIDQ